MSIELVADTLLRAHAPLVAVVGQRIALQEPAEGTQAPYVVYQIVSDVAVQYTGELPTTWIARIQVNPVAQTINQLISIRALVAAALESNTQRTVAGTRVLVCRREFRGPLLKDEFTGLWTRSEDFSLTYE